MDTSVANLCVGAAKTDIAPPLHVPGMDRDPAPSQSFITALANGCLGYLAPEEDWNAGGIRSAGNAVTPIGPRRVRNGCATPRGDCSRACPRSELNPGLQPLRETLHEILGEPEADVLGFGVVGAFVAGVRDDELAAGAS